MMWILALALLHAQVVLLGAGHVGYNWQRGNRSLAHCANSYCNPFSDIKKAFQGPYLGSFTAVQEISSDLYDVKGYVGYDVVDKAIYVVLKGTSSLQNYWMDVITKLVPYPLCKGCEVHEGFLLSEQAIHFENSIMSTIRHLKLQHPSFDIICTGHSLGGALATLIALGVLNESDHSSNTLQLYTFGSPRVGNAQFALYAYDKIPLSFRVVHHQDVIPHLPPESFGFVHIAGEWYQPADTAELVRCLSQVTRYEITEDLNCSSQWNVFETSISDHLTYLTVPIGEESCQFVETLQSSELQVETIVEKLASSHFVDEENRSQDISSITIILLIGCAIIVTSIVSFSKVFIFTYSKRSEYVELTGTKNQCMHE